MRLRTWLCKDRKPQPEFPKGLISCGPCPPIDREGFWHIAEGSDGFSVDPDCFGIILNPGDCVEVDISPVTPK